METNSTLTLGQAARELGVSASTLRRWTKRNLVPYYLTPGGQRRFSREQLRQIEKQSLSASEAAHELGVSPRTVRRWANRGLVPFTTSPGGKRQFTWEQVREIQERMRHQPVASSDHQEAA